MKKLWKKRCADVTIGELTKFSIIAMIVITAISGGLCWLILMLDDIMSALEEFRDLVSDRIHGYKGMVDSEEDEEA